MPALVALAQFDTLFQPLVLLFVLGGVIFLIDNVLMPKLQADRLNIDPVIVLLSPGLLGRDLRPAGGVHVDAADGGGDDPDRRVPQPALIATLLSKEGEVLHKIPAKAG